MALGEHLMHRGERKPALQHRIRFRMAERDLVEVMRIAMRLDAARCGRANSQACCVRALLMRPLPSENLPLPLLPE